MVFIFKYCFENRMGNIFCLSISVTKFQYFKIFNSIKKETNLEVLHFLYSHWLICYRFFRFYLAKKNKQFFSKKGILLPSFFLVPFDQVYWYKFGEIWRNLIIRIYFYLSPITSQYKIVFINLLLITLVDLTILLWWKILLQTQS